MPRRSRLGWILRSSARSDAPRDERRGIFNKVGTKESTHQISTPRQQDQLGSSC